MKIKLLVGVVIWVLAFENNVFAQKEHYVWYFGDSAGVDFNSGSPLPLTNGMTNTYEGVATISDANGNLLFYSDGVRVWDSSHAQMPNGYSLNGASTSTQSALIVPFPNNSMLYYIFTVYNDLNYSVVDMSLNNGKGDVTIKNNFMLSSVGEKLTAVRHSNNTDIWVMVRGTTNNNFYCFPVNSGGVSITPVISSIGPVFTSSDGIGYMKFSPDGNKIAFATYYSYYVDLFDFNSTSGLVSNEKYLTLPAPSSNGVYGIEFSNNMNYLYATLFIPRLVIQWDISSNDTSIINSTLQQIGVSSAQWLGALQLAPDGKIYVAEHNTSFLGVINYPDSAGLSSDYVDNAISLNGTFCEIGLPNFMTSYFLPTGININNPQHNQLTIYPNPASDKIYISFPASATQIMKTKLYSITGEVVFAEENKSTVSITKFQIPISQITNGLYFLSVQAGREMMTRKIMVQH